MNTVKIGICTSVTNASTLSDSGLEFIEEHVQNFLMPEQGEEIFQPNLGKTRPSPLPVIAANCFLPATMKCVGPSVDTPRLLRYADTAFRRAALVGIKIIVFGSGGARQVPDGFPKASAEEQFVALLKEMGPLARRQRVTIVVEPLNRAECNIINSVTEGAAIVRRCDHPNVRLLADFYHMAREGQSPDEIVQAGDLLRHVHIAEREKRTAPGTMGDDFRPYLRALKKIGYAGAISLECGWTDIKTEAARSIACLRKQIEEASC